MTSGLLAAATNAPTDGFVIAGPLFWLPLLAAVLFANGAVLLKRSAEWRIDIYRTTFLSNLTTAALFVPMIPFSDSIPPVAELWKPLLVGLLFFFGQLTALIALTRGEVSVAAPVLGLKIVLVAILSTIIIGNALPSSLWVACGVATVGVGLLNVSDGNAHRGSLMISLVFGLLSAASFALFDVCVQKWAPQYGMTTFLPWVFAGAAVLSMGLIAGFRGRLSEIPLPAWKYLAGGCLLMAFQSLSIVCAVATWGHAAEANVVYSTRGLWGVLVIWAVGPWLGVSDAGLHGRVLMFRLAGAFLLFIAIASLIV